MTFHKASLEEKNSVGTKIVSGEDDSGRSARLIYVKTIKKASQRS